MYDIMFFRNFIRFFFEVLVQFINIILYNPRFSKSLVVPQKILAAARYQQTFQLKVLPHDR